MLNHQIWTLNESFANQIPRKKYLPSDLVRQYVYRNRTIFIGTEINLSSTSQHNIENLPLNSMSANKQAGSQTLCRLPAHWRQRRSPPICNTSASIRTLSGAFRGEIRSFYLFEGMGVFSQFVDHERKTKSQDYRMDSAWFGQGANLKQRALDHALQLVA